MLEERADEPTPRGPAGPGADGGAPGPAGGAFVGFGQTARAVRRRAGASGAALRILHHIRTVSAHPDLSAKVQEAEFIIASARLDATFAIRRRIRDAGERALVFIEHIRLQHRFIELARLEFGLTHIELINGSTPIASRQQAVERFQRHLRKL